MQMWFEGETRAGETVLVNLCTVTSVVSGTDSFFVSTAVNDKIEIVGDYQVFRARLLGLLDSQ